MRYFTDGEALFEEAGRFRGLTALRNVVTREVVDMSVAELALLRVVLPEEDASCAVARS